MHSAYHTNTLWTVSLFNIILFLKMKKKHHQHSFQSNDYFFNFSFAKFVLCLRLLMLYFSYKFIHNLNFFHLSTIFFFFYCLHGDFFQTSLSLSLSLYFILLRWKNSTSKKFSPKKTKKKKKKKKRSNGKWKMVVMGKLRKKNLLWIKMINIFHNHFTQYILLATKHCILMNRHHFCFHIKLICFLFI